MYDGSCQHAVLARKFTGKERDSESNLDHTWFRQYSSSLGRWMHPDPAGLAAVDPFNPQSWNRYAYVTNSPLAFIDPSGLGPNDCEVHAHPHSFAPYPCGNVPPALLGCGVDWWNCSGLWGWDEFDLLELAITPTGMQPNPDCPNGDCANPWIPVYGNIGLLGAIGGGGNTSGGNTGGNTSGRPQQPSRLSETLTRAKVCAKAYYGFNTLPGAATDATRVGTLLAAAPLPKSWLATLGIRTTTLAGGSSFTNILSVLGQGAGTAASGANVLRIAGRAAGPVAIASAAIDVTAIAVCTLTD